MAVRGRYRRAVYTAVPVVVDLETDGGSDTLAILLTLARSSSLSSRALLAGSEQVPLFVDILEQNEDASCEAAIRAACTRRLPFARCAIPGRVESWPCYVSTIAI